MPTQETVILVAVIGGISAVLVLFTLSITGVFVIKPLPPSWQRPDDVTPNYENNTAIVTLGQGQKSGFIIVDRISPAGDVKIDKITPHAVDVDVVPVVMRMGDATSSCQARITLLNVTSSSATFEMTSPGMCPICWHIFSHEY